MSSGSSSSRRVLMPMDGSEHSYRALQWYQQNLNSPNDILLFAHVAEPKAVFVTPTSSSSAEASNFGITEAVEQAKTLSGVVTQRCKQLGIQVAETKFLERLGHGAGETIVQLANEENADLIVMGNRGIGTVRRTFMGSVSDYVLHHAHRPVAIVPPAKNKK